VCNHDNKKVANHLQAALAHLGAALALVGGLWEPPEADDALDAALAQDQGVKDARQTLQNALEAVRGAGVEEDLRALEEAQNALASRCMEVGYRVGWILGRLGQ
jgi:hypothetical protein